MESEITVQVFTPIEKIDEILKSQNFSLIDEYDLIDWYFSKYSYKKLKQFSYKRLIKNSFLIRKIVGESTKYQLCYKDKKIVKNQVVEETKIISRLDNLEKTLEIFKNANLTNWCNVQNHTLVYKKDNICFALQIIKDLGIFIEYEEDEEMKNLSPNLKIKTMKKIVNSLGLELGNDYNIKKPYLLFKTSNQLD